MTALTGSGGFKEGNIIAMRDRRNTARITVPRPTKLYTKAVRRLIAEYGVRIVIIFHSDSQSLRNSQYYTYCTYVLCVL